METVAELLESAARWCPTHPLVSVEDGTLTYGEVNGEANRVAHALLARGLRPGEPVALFMPSQPVFVTAYYGIVKAGGIAAPLNAVFTIFPRRPVWCPTLS